MVEIASTGARGGGVNVDTESGLLNPDMFVVVAAMMLMVLPSQLAKCKTVVILVDMHNDVESILTSPAQ